MTSIRQLISAVTEGRVRIPAFQRGFVWDSDRVAQLMDSIYKGYPFGALLFWRTKAELQTERDLGPFILPPRPADYPVDYVLDGQQRLTSIFGVFQTELKPAEATEWTNIYFDYRSDAGAQDSQFLALSPADADPDRYFPLAVLFDAPAYGEASRKLSSDVIAVIDDLHSKFKEVSIPIQSFATDDRAGVAIVFERVNRLGVELDTLQLLSAWTWSDDFDLQRKFSELSEELEPFGFGDVGEEITLLLRCCAAIVEGDASPKAMISMKGAKVRELFPHVINGIRGAIDFVRRELGVQQLANLPYASTLVPLSVFFSAPDGRSVSYSDAQRRIILRWFWRACFSARYGRSVTPSLAADISEIKNLRAGRKCRLTDMSVNVDESLFLRHQFKLSTVLSRTFILMLAQQRPRSLVSGQSIDLAAVLKSYNRNEFHHIYPQAYLRSAGIDVERHSLLANICFISSIDNKILGGDSPATYRVHLASPELTFPLAFVPEHELFSGDYEAFVKARARLLASEANRVMGL
ncbi:DUF262 domain-containing protein [Micromonospora aurantiaca]|uniref:GmrSD restriction endonuclease domain-containing protein n=1 Tax=Micromonospora aurantiaca (nom. illeg.) TaxID=47850 RepID=UPI0034520991